MIQPPMLQVVLLAELVLDVTVFSSLISQIYSVNPIDQELQISQQL